MANLRPFRFGVLGEHTDSHEGLVKTARTAEEAGYATFVIRDHFIEEPFGHQLAPLTTLATVAAKTTRLRVGSLVIAADYRHPVVLAKEAATLDLLSGGRFEIGLGSGFSRAEYEQAGMTFDPPGVRVERFAETVRVVKGLFAEQPLTFNGAHYRIRDLDGFPKPAQWPHPPILVGAGGRRMLTIAAREADIVGILTASVGGGRLDTADATGSLAASVAERIGWIREAAGDRFDQIELSIVCTIVVTAGRRRAAAEIIRARGWEGVSTDDVLEMPSVFAGTIEQIVEKMHERRRRYGLSYYVVSDRVMEAAAPIVARLAGA